MKFAYLIMGEFDSRQDRAEIHEGAAQIIGVSNLGEACLQAQRLVEEGVNVIELCGAFGEEGARMIIEATGCRVPVGFVGHLQEQALLFEQLFG